MLAPNAQFWLPFLETPIFFNPLSFKNYLMKIHKFGKKQNTKGQIYRCKKLNQDICYTFLIIHDLKCPRICGHAVHMTFLLLSIYLNYILIHSFSSAETMTLIDDPLFPTGESRKRSVSLQSNNSDSG